MDATDISICPNNPLRVKQLLDRVENKTLLVKEPPTWSNNYKSQLIESLFLLLPLPSFFINARNDRQWVTIDGSARLNTLKEYVVDQSFSLTGLEFFPEQEGKKFSDLAPRWRRRIVERKLDVHIILAGTSGEVADNLTRKYTQQN